MSLAIEWGTEGSDRALFVYFDAVTAYKRSFKGKVTEHPIDSGATIADHFVKQNPKISVTAVITGADISVGRDNIKNQESDKPVNAYSANRAVSIEPTSGKFNSLLPEGLGQLFSPQAPEISFEPFPNPDITDRVKEAMIDLVHGERLNEITGTFTNNMQLVRLYEYDNTTIRTIIPNLVVVGLEFDETADSGDALYCKIIFQQVQFSSGKRATLPDDIAEELLPKAAESENKGKQDSTVEEISDEEDSALEALIRSYLEGRE